MIAQYGYLTLFAPAYSLMPIFALFNNILTIRIDAVKFCWRLRRPNFRVSEDIGSWWTTTLLESLFHLNTHTDPHWGLVLP